VSNDNNLFKVVCREDLRDGKTGSRLPIERGASYPIADWEYLVDSVGTRRGRAEGTVVPPR